MTTNAQTKWYIDPKHSEVKFKVRHLAITNVGGTFKTFSGEVQAGNDGFKDAVVGFELYTNSIDTNLAERDGHLKSPLFFDAEKFPKITFSGILLKQDNGYELDGGLTIFGITKAVRLEVEFNGIEKDVNVGLTRAGFEVNGKINRNDFGLTWNKLTEAGNFVVGEEVKLHFDIQLIKQA